MTVLAILAGQLVVLTVVALAALAVVIGVRAPHRAGVADHAIVAAARRHAAVTALAAGGVGATTLLVVGVLGQEARVGGSAPGLLTALAPAAAGLAYLVTHHVGERTRPRPTSTVRTAALERRTVAAVAPRAHRALLWGWVALTAVAVLVFGLLGDATSVGITQVLADGSVTTSSAGPFPGWAYGPPLLTGTLAVAVTAELVLRSVARRPAVTAGPDDLVLRRRSGARAVRGAQLAVAVTLTGILATAGLSISNGTDDRVAGAVVLVLAAAVGLTGLVAAALPTAGTIDAPAAEQPQPVLPADLPTAR
jgi:hypothetical protein